MAPTAAAEKQPSLHHPAKQISVYSAIKQLVSRITASADQQDKDQPHHAALSTAWTLLLDLDTNRMEVRCGVL